MAIVHAKSYLDLILEIYREGSLSSVLDINPTLVRPAANSKNFLIKQITTQGPANYSRTNGYVKGATNTAWQEIEPAYDRGRSFTVDSMDELEARMDAATVTAAYLREWSLPEVDAFRFSHYASEAAVLKPTDAALANGAAVLSALSDAQTALDEQEVPKTERYLFITPTLARMAREKAPTSDQKAVLDDFAQIIEVPQTRFYKGITLLDGTTQDQEDGGYTKTASTGRDINFLIIHKGAVMQGIKHNVGHLITPEENQTSDGWMFKFRTYGFVDAVNRLDANGKIKGIYAHIKNT